MSGTSQVERRAEQSPRLYIVRAALQFRDVCISTYIKDGREKPASAHFQIRAAFEEEITNRYNLSSAQVREIVDQLYETEGFIASDGKFYNRNEAKFIAKSARQMKQEDVELISENVITDERYPS